MTRYRTLLLVPLFSLTAAVMGQTPRGLVDESTRWEFAMAATASVDSSLIRLGDVLRPLQRDMAAWPRLSGATVGLMPIDGSPAQLSRDRLADLIARGQATPTKISIHGPEHISVIRIAPSPTTDSPVQQTVYSSNTDLVQSAFPSEVLQRLTTWALLGIKNHHREIADAYDVTVSVDPTTVGTLDRIAGIRELRLLDPVPIWTAELAASGEKTQCRIAIEGRAEGDACHGQLTLHLSPRPAVVVATRSMGRGTRVGEGDVVFRPAAYSASEDSPLQAFDVASPDELIGMEVTSVVREGIPLSRSQFEAPRLIRRGELLEVQVSGGGIRVTTAAKSMSEGAEGDLIEIETLQPKRRLLARVISSALVEVMTQPTQVRESR